VVGGSKTRMFIWSVCPTTVPNNHELFHLNSFLYETETTKALEIVISINFFHVSFHQHQRLFARHNAFCAQSSVMLLPQSSCCPLIFFLHFEMIFVCISKRKCKAFLFQMYIIFSVVYRFRGRWMFTKMYIMITMMASSWTIWIGFLGKHYLLQHHHAHCRYHHPIGNSNSV